jgi:hypothetical protein
MDYRYYIANTGLAKVSIANPNLDGTGTVTTLLVAGGDGCQINHISVKACQSTSIGMVRLFINDGINSYLFKEVNIPEMVASKVENAFQVILHENLYLQPNHSILAATENAESFDLIAFTSDWEQCKCGSDLLKISTTNFANNGIKMIEVPNPNLDGTGVIETIYTVPTGAAGAVIEEVGVKALGDILEGIIRLWIFTGTKYFLITELLVPAEVQSPFEPAFRTSFKRGFFLQEGFSICASTEEANQFNISVYASLIKNCGCN